MGQDKKPAEVHAVEEAKECYTMGTGGAWFEALLTNARFDYRTEQGRMQIKDGCFDDLVKPQLMKLGDTPEHIEKIRLSARKR